MAQATTTTEGEIVLAGDLTGDANAPELRASGVTPGSYTVAARVSVDSKGRVTFAGPQIGDELLSIAPDASSSTKGIASFGAGITVTAGAASLTPMAAATSSNLGAVRVGTNLSISDGELSLPQANAFVKGVFSPGADISVSSGVATANYNLTTVEGSIPLASSTVFGKVAIGPQFSNSGGQVVANEATTSTKGVASFDSSWFSLTAGACSFATSVLRSLSINYTYTAQQIEQATVVNASSLPSNTLTLDQNAGPVTIVNLDTNLTISFSTGSVAAMQCALRKILIVHQGSPTRTVTLTGTFRANRTLVFSSGSEIDSLQVIHLNSTNLVMLNEKFI